MRCNHDFMMKLTKWTWVRALALTATVAFVWGLNYDRLSPDTWSVPVDYYEDSPMVLGWIKSAQDGDFVPFLSKDISRLGAPYTGNWNDWPMWGEELIFLIGLLAKVFGLFTAANLGVVLGYVTNALAFYACCRLLRFQRLWSFVGAVLFAFTYFHAYRGLHHLLHVYSYMVPFGILSCWLIAFSKRLRWGGGLAWVCLVTAAITGLTNPYNLNMFGQLLCLSLGVQLLTARRKVNLQIGFVSLALIVVSFLAINLDTFSYQWAHGKNPDGLQRSYYESELFGLKPMELVIPPTNHKVTALATIGSKYVAQAWLKGELFSPYLGIVCIAGLIWMGFEGLLLLLKKKRFPRRFPAYSLQSLWVLFYGVVGGLNCLIGIAGLPLFRGTNRYSIFISALILIFLVSRVSILSRRWQPAFRYALAGAVLLFGLFDQLPQAMHHEETTAIARNIEIDRAFVAKMEEKLPAKAMVFQLPVMPYPESTPVNNLQAYELLRPYFFSKTLRFSFGSNKGRPREDWQKEVEKLPPQQMVNALERYGFSAIYLNRKGFADQGESLIKQLSALGKNQIIDDELHEQVCIVLTPVPTPELPPAGSRAQLMFHDGWTVTAPSPAGIQRWTSANASLSFFNHDKQYSSYSLKCQIGSLSPRRVVIEVNGKELWRAELSANQLVPVNLVIDARAGYNKVRFNTDVKVRPAKNDPLPRALVVVNPQITRTEAATK